MSDDDTLWDPKGSDEIGGAGEDADELRSLSERLGAHRYRPRPWVVPETAVWKTGPGSPEDGQEDDPGQATGFDLEQGRRSVFAAAGGGRVLRMASLLAGAAVVLLLLAETFGWYGFEDGGGRLDPASDSVYVVEALQGLPSIRRHGSDEDMTHERMDLQPGDEVVCDDVTRAELLVAEAGTVRLEPNSRLRVDGGSGGREGWRLFLEEGQLTASIFAAPRLFQVGTPSGIAVDLGCFYTATVAENGETVLTVRGGQVSFETEQRKVFVPSGARVVARPGRGPGTPVWEDAPAALRSAVDSLDRLVATDPLDTDARWALEELGRLEEPRQSLTLWHLLEHPQGEVAGRARELLAALSPPPEGVQLKGIAAGNVAMRTRWRQVLESSW